MFNQTKRKAATGSLSYVGCVIAVVLLSSIPFVRELCASDWRNIWTGYEIPSESYADQPYVVITRDGNWLCTLTTGRGREGQVGQSLIVLVCLLLAGRSILTLEANRCANCFSNQPTRPEVAQKSSIRRISSTSSEGLRRLQKQREVDSARRTSEFCC